MFLRPARDPHGIPGVKKFRVVPGNLRTDKTRHVEAFLSVVLNTARYRAAFRRGGATALGH